MIGRLGLVPGWLENAKEFPTYGPCFSAFVDDEFVACSGVSIVWPGVGEAWSVITPLIYKYPLFFHKSVKTGLEKIIREKNLHRVQATVVEYFYQGEKWLKALGFLREGLLRRYDLEGNNHWIYGRVM